MMNTRKQGFTIIELLLAMSFISVLLLAIAMTILQVSQSYNRGITLNEVNQAGRAISLELTRAIQGSNGIMPIADPSNESAPWKPNRDHFRTNNDGGRLCVGQYSYIWNYGKTINAGIDVQLNKFQGATSASKPVTFIKVADPGGYYCRGADAVTPAIATTAASSELLARGDHSLAVHSFSITTSPASIDTASSQVLYVINFVIGTNDTAALRSVDPNNPDSILCEGPGEEGADIEYCSVQQFTIAVRASNAVN